MLLQSHDCEASHELEMSHGEQPSSYRTEGQGDASSTAHTAYLCEQCSRLSTKAAPAKVCFGQTSCICEPVVTSYQISDQSGTLPGFMDMPFAMYVIRPATLPDNRPMPVSLLPFTMCYGCRTAGTFLLKPTGHLLFVRHSANIGSRPPATRSGQC